MSFVITSGFLLVAAVICVYGVHRSWLVWLYLRSRHDGAGPEGERTCAVAVDDASLPTVTVQLPMFNEHHVASRVIDAACSLDYPRSKLSIQVLDDSTDSHAQEIVREACARWRARGVQIDLIHRESRSGYKAGALAAGLQHAPGAFIAVFDADFVPQPGFLREMVPHLLDDPSVGMVQARWAHLNRGESLLTECQGMFLDGHFVVEQAARFHGGRWFNFNGTAGVWRRACIEDAGGWEHDTLTEDADLSYRAQLRGWRFVYDDGVTVPAELPPRMSAFLSQQHRWTKGLIQCGLKLLPRILRSDASWKIKLEAFFHLTAPIVYVAILLLTLLALPAAWATPAIAWWPGWVSMVLVFSMLALGTTTAAAFYVVAERALGYRTWETVLYVPALMALGIGVSVINARAVIEALLGIRSGFVRTPKFNQQREASVDPAIAEDAPRTHPHRGRYHALRHLYRPGVIELGLALVSFLALGLTVTERYALIGAPFLLLFAAGYMLVGVPRLRATR